MQEQRKHAKARKEIQVKGHNLYVYVCMYVFVFQCHVNQSIQFTAVGSWVLLDPKIGCWLLNPDQPPVTFMQTVLTLNAPLPQVK